MDQLIVTNHRLHLPRLRFRGRGVALTAVVVGGLLVAGIVGNAVRDRTPGTAVGNPLPAITRSGLPAQPSMGAPNVSGASGKATSGADSAASTSAPAVTAGGDLPALDASSAIIRSGSVDMTVRSVGDAFDQVRALTAQFGGTVADSSFTGGNSQGTAQLTLRVPSDHFDEVVTRLRGLAVEVKTVSTNARDASGDVTDLDATLRNLRAVETRYATLLDQAKSISEILQVQDRLNQVRLQIDRTDARRQLLGSQIEMATLSVGLRAASATAHAGPASPLAHARQAWDASLQTLEQIATVALVAVIYAWWMLALAIAGVLMARRFFWHRTPTQPL